MPKKKKVIKTKYAPRKGDVVYLKTNGKINKKVTYVFLRTLNIAELALMTGVVIDKNLWNVFHQVMGDATFQEDYNCIVAGINAKDNEMVLTFASTNNLVLDIMNTIKCAKTKGFKKFTNGLVRYVNKDIKNKEMNLPNKAKPTK